MILAHGKIYENSCGESIIAAMPEEICRTLSEPQLAIGDVISACDRLSVRALSGEFDSTAKPLLEMLRVTEERYAEYCRMFSADALSQKVARELGDTVSGEVQVSEHLYRERRPLGVLLHIAAGNVDVLPAYSVMEGLLSGNINILKLPTGDSGVSVKLLSELIGECPRLADYIYVFDVPSTEIHTIKKLAEMADGVVVWGGDEAVRAARQFSKTDTKLIEWGHKLSFAYAHVCCSDRKLEKLAEEICQTNQMLCTSTQGIFVDTESAEELETFGRRFFEILKTVNRRMGSAPMGMRGKNTLKLYTDRLEGKDTILSEEGVSVVIKADREPELSCLFRNVWIKALPRKEIISALKHKKGYLQTCALMMEDPNAREEAIELMKRAGITRITDPTVPDSVIGEAHDGKFPLREYSRLVDVYR